jgi:NAD(P)H-dependent FMN reductase
MGDPMAEPITIAVLAGTTRVQRESIKAAHYVADLARRLDGVEVIFVDPVDFYFPGDGNDPEGKDARYTEIVKKADAFFIVTPEYNHSFPGTLKRMLDSELQLYNHKPVAFAGASDGNWGGVRAVEALLTAVRETGLVALSWDVYFPYVNKMFNEDGSIKDEHRERYERNVGKLFDELLRFARMLKQMRYEEQEV